MKAVFAFQCGTAWPRLWGGWVSLNWGKAAAGSGEDPSPRGRGADGSGAGCAVCAAAEGSAGVRGGQEGSRSNGVGSRNISPSLQSLLSSETHADPRFKCSF